MNAQFVPATVHVVTSSSSERVQHSDSANHIWELSLAGFIIITFRCSDRSSVHERAPQVTSPVLRVELTLELQMVDAELVN